MTQKQFENRCASLIKAFEREVRKKDMEAARLKFREEEGLIYVKKHTVQAYFRRRKPRRRARVNESVGQTLN